SDIYIYETLITLRDSLFSRILCPYDIIVVSARYHRATTTNNGIVSNVLLYITCAVYSISKIPITDAKDVVFISVTNSLPVGGTIIRKACGSTMYQYAAILVMPRASAASNCPLSIAIMPPLNISAI